jgi:CheY-like chemotaxis protein
MMKDTLCFLVDDDPDDQEIFALALEDLQEHVTLETASNALEAIEMLNQGLFIPDFIFIDLNMPRMNGNELLARINTLAGLEQTRFIIFSTSSELRDNSQFKTPGAVAFIQKPPSITALSGILQKVFREHKKTLPVHEAGRTNQVNNSKGKLRQTGRSGTSKTLGSDRGRRSRAARQS